MSDFGRGTHQRRLLGVVRALLDGEQLDRRELGRRLQARLATADRYLRDIKSTLPIAVTREGRTRRYALDLSGVNRKPTLAEAIAASFGAGFAGVFQGTRYRADLQELREHIIRSLHEQKQSHFQHIGRKLIVLSQQAELLDGRDEDFDTVLDCVLRQRVLLGRYQRFTGREEHLRLKPYSIVIAGGHLYVVAPNATGDLHPFRFVRFREVEASDESFIYPKVRSYDPSALFKDSFGVFLNLPVARVRLRFEKRWSPFLLTHRWHHSQRASEGPNGGIVISLKVRACPELERWVPSFGDEVEVLAPSELRLRVAQRARAMAANYR